MTDTVDSNMYNASGRTKASVHVSVNIKKIRQTAAVISTFQVIALRIHPAADR